jgi:hypothetical protein
MNKIFDRYNSEIKSIVIWSTYVLLPLIIEIFTSLLISGIYVLIVSYFLTKGVLTSFDLAILFYFLSAWIYAIYVFFKNGSAFVRSLLGWHIFIVSTIRKNPWSVIPIIALMILLLFFSQKPDINTNKLNLFQTRLESIVLNLKTVDNWSKYSTENLNSSLTKYQEIDKDFSKSIQRFSKPPNIATLPSSSQEIDNLLSDFYSLIAHLNSGKVDISSTNNSLNENLGILEDNVKQVSNIKQQSRTICQDTEQNKNLDKCNSITGLTQELEKEIEKLKLSLEQVQKLSAQITKSDINRQIISPKLREVWQIELQKRKSFDLQRTDEWLKETTDLMAITQKKMSQVQQESPIYKTEIDEALRVSNLARIEYDRISDNVKNRELRLISINDTDPNIILESSNRDKISLTKQNTNLNNIEKSVKRLLPDIELKLDELISNKNTLIGSKGTGYILLIQANNTSDRTYIDSIRDKKTELDNLYTKLGNLIKETRVFKKIISNESGKILLELGTMKSISADLDSRNDELIARIKSAILSSNLKTGIPIFISIFTIGMIIWLQSRKQLVNRISNVNKNKAVAKLIEVIQDVKEPQAVRFHAIDVLYHEIPSVTKQEVALIKKKVKDLSNSPLKENVRVAARLRDVALALEHRLREKEQIGG